LGFEFLNNIAANVADRQISDQLCELIEGEFCLFYGFRVSVGAYYLWIRKIFSKRLA